MVLRVREVSVPPYQPWCMYQPVLGVPPTSAHHMIMNVFKGTVNLKHLSPGSWAGSSWNLKLHYH